MSRTFPRFFIAYIINVKRIGLWLQAILPAVAGKKSAGPRGKKVRVYFRHKMRIFTTYVLRIFLQNITAKAAFCYG